WLNRLCVTRISVPKIRTTHSARCSRWLLHSAAPYSTHSPTRASHSHPKSVFVSTSPSADVVKAANKVVPAPVETCSINSSSAATPTSSQPIHTSAYQRLRKRAAESSFIAGCHTNSQKPTLPTASARLIRLNQRMATPSGATRSSSASVLPLTTLTPTPKAKLPSVGCPSAAETTRHTTVYKPCGKLPGCMNICWLSAGSIWLGGVSTGSPSLSSSVKRLKAGSSGSVNHSRISSGE